MACRRSPDSLAMRCCAAASSLLMRVAGYAICVGCRLAAACAASRGGRLHMASRRKFLQAAAGGVLMAHATQAAKQAGGPPPGELPQGKYKVTTRAPGATPQPGQTGGHRPIAGV